MAQALPSAAYTGRFAPTPSGPLHAGSLITALASYLDARAHQGRWHLRIEDIDTPRVVHGADQHIMQQLQALEMRWDAPPIWQSRRLRHYQAAFKQLEQAGSIYGCACTRAQLPPGPYPGICRDGLAAGTGPRAWRWRVPAGRVSFEDRWAGPQTQDVAQEVGDFILRRADGVWTYQLAVVVDDAAQHITHIVRGADLLDSTARQILLTQALGALPALTLHVPLLCDTQGYKLSKQNHAPALDLTHPLETLLSAWRALGFDASGINTLEAFWPYATQQWHQRFP
ncbi:tRNA glutamyl-Q(34) synthetase GluQRS [Alcaligenaceae bacterium CGII-47]|nr:tRNA glutamyl-Q(34) synthetase GluQRS [Alcaligenaceae bacterium CGII-47]